MLANIAWPVMATIISALASVIGGLVLFNLKLIKRCVTNQNDSIRTLDAKVSDVVTDQANCRNECTRTYVDKVDFIRNVAKQENTLESLIKITSEIKGGMAIIEKIPQLCGEVTRQIVKDLKNG